MRFFSSLLYTRVVCPPEQQYFVSQGSLDPLDYTSCSGGCNVPLAVSVFDYRSVYFPYGNPVQYYLHYEGPQHLTSSGHLKSCVVNWMSVDGLV